jgi:hypothetical protein
MKKKNIYPFIAAIINLPLWAVLQVGGLGLVIWSLKRKPHAAALEQFGIRIVSPKDYVQHGREGDQPDENEVYRALLLLSEFDRRELKRVQKHIRTIFLVSDDYLISKDTKSISTSYSRSGRVCLVNFQRVLRKTTGETNPASIASYLVFVATNRDWQSKALCLCHRQAAINLLCHRAARTIRKKISEGVCQ